MTTSMEGIRRYKAQEFVAKKEAVVDALRALDRGAEAPSISAVARIANVSRPFIHDNREIYEMVVNELARIEKATLDDSGTAEAPSESPYPERSALINSVTRYRTENARLRTLIVQLESKQAQRRDLGMQLEELHAPSDVEMSLAIAAADRLQDENLRLTRELSDAKALIEQLREDLIVLRQALAEELHGKEGNGKRLRPLD